MSDSSLVQTRLIHGRRTTLALMALALASAICVAMLVARALYARELKFSFLPGNLVLAWIPLVFALAVYTLRARRSQRWTLLAGCAVVWFLFFPNAPYLITDLVHLKTREPIPRWYDLILFMSFAWTGLFLGSLSLYLMQEVVRSWLGRAASWRFAIAMLALGALGVFLGRFWRWNSWEMLTRPFGLARDAVRRINEMGVGEAAAFSATFFAFSLMTYLMLYTITHLHGHVETPKTG
jgi:uncharacterized membrane protein